ncbi:MAG: T9SS type A sorting domain-containing protein, partial [Bacteroidetes bacterium]|nr:T9SS type A sorting domain-containing protein [Bacteroidota bacterium]
TDAADNNIISAFNHDLAAGSGTPEYRVFTVGTAGSQVTTIQFKNLRDKTTLPVVQYDNIQFQIRLYEGTNKIELVYGTWTISANATAFKSAAAGVKTTAPAVVVTKSSSGIWSAATFLNGNYVGNAFNFRNTVLPDAGRTFGFTPATATADVAVSAVFTLGKLPIGVGVPHIVTGRFRNADPCSPVTFVATLNITGANTFTNTQNVTIPAASSLDVNFAGFSPTVAGVNVVTLSKPSDNNNANNSAVYRQEVTTTTYSYSDTAASVNSIGYNTSAGLILNKYTVTGSVKVNTVNVYLANAPTVGKKVFAVVLDAAGTIVGMSDTLVPASGDLNKYYSFTVKTPPTVTNASFFVGLAQVANAVGYYPVGMQTEVNPGRNGAYYTAPLAGGAAPAEANTFGRFMIEAVVTNITGIASYELSNSNLLVFPNPANDQLNLIFTDKTAESFDMKLIGLNGQVVYSENIKQFAGQFSHTLNVSGYAKGIYFLQVTTDKAVSTKKIVIQ